MPEKIISVQIKITGVVQGVGFRPFIYSLARKFELLGWVQNTSSGVDIEVEGEEKNINIFVEGIKFDAPILAKVEDIEVKEVSNKGFQGFVILESKIIPSAFQPVSPDVAICQDCQDELFDPSDRRYRYPFINCTNCGPRFTIIHDIPYDRPKTSMAIFEMCSECATEYKDPVNRRFHAQPIACPKCGPDVWLEIRNHNKAGTKYIITQKGGDAILHSRELLKEGKILAIKGLGGFHLACDGKNSIAVTELRRRKLRIDKPFAVMMDCIETVEKYCFLDSEERKLLTSPAHPIVLLKLNSSEEISTDIAPGQNSIGVMLPYTPLHALLLQKATGFPDVLVMTSGNISEEPICTDNDDAREHLRNLADAFLMHNREIHIRTDDSVMRIVKDKTYPIRRSRGYAPYPVKLPWNVLPILGTGAELKNTFCVTNENFAFLSHHIGDLQNYQTLKSFEDGIGHFERMYRVKPAVIACDMHPDYLCSRYAHERASREIIPVMEIQHHHAHVASVMAEKGMDSTRQVLGIAFDGTGYGDDGAIWGGEFLIANYSGYQRVAHLAYFPLAGGDVSIRRPSRTALSLMYSLGIDWGDGGLPTHNDICAKDRTLLFNQLEKRINTPMTSSIGRLFDAVAALSGVRQKVNYEAQAAIELEALVDNDEKGYYEFEYNDGKINPKPMIENIISDYYSKVPVTKISAKFHNGLAVMVSEVSNQIREKYGVTHVVLSGGVWQNINLLNKTTRYLEENKFVTHIHQLVPTNDAGISLGQAAITAYRSIQ